MFKGKKVNNKRPDNNKKEEEQLSVSEYKLPNSQKSITSQLQKQNLDAFRGGAARPRSGCISTKSPSKNPLPRSAHPTLRRLSRWRRLAKEQTYLKGDMIRGFHRSRYREARLNRDDDQHLRKARKTRKGRKRRASNSPRLRQEASGAHALVLSRALLWKARL